MELQSTTTPSPTSALPPRDEEKKETIAQIRNVRELQSPATASPTSALATRNEEKKETIIQSPKIIDGEKLDLSSLFSELPNNVSTQAQLAGLPNECRGDDPSRPLRYVDEHDQAFKYHLRPMFYSVIFILLVELLERFAFYGLLYTQASYLTGAYNKNWNADMEAVEASSYVSISTAIAYTAPFLGAFLADSILGEFWAILLGSLVLYIPGLLLIFMTTIPGLLGDTFNHTALRFGLLVFWPIGTGIVKSVVNVFGAKQHHPILQSSLIESYYVNFYMCINIGALAGGIIVPIVAQHNVSLAYFIPVVILSIGVALFTIGSPRYVRARPHGDLFAKESSDSSYGSLGLSVIARVSALIIPFCIAYSQMATTFIVQGTVMRKAFGFIDAASMNNADAISVLFFGYVIGNNFYPALAKRGIKIPTTYKFAIGSALGAMAIGWALVVEYKIHAAFKQGETVSILWQSLAYVLIGAGEIFAVSAAYETAFTAAPPKKKALASAVNLFFVGGVPNFLCIYLYHACRAWFRNARGNTNITELKDYASAQVGKYFAVLFLIALFGVFVNMVSPVRDWVASIEEKAAEAVRTPMSTPRGTPTLKQRKKERQADFEDEEAPLLKAKKHQEYLKYGSGPVLYKHGSMRAGAGIVKPKEKTPLTAHQKYLKYGKGPVLYKPGSFRAGMELGHPHEQPLAKQVKKDTIGLDRNQ